MAVREQGVGRESWRSARLIPTIGIRGQEEQEQRATSSLIAVMFAVPQFGRALLSHLDAPKGRIATYTEIAFSNVDGERCRPDGAIVIERGKTNWCCLVEVKTGSAQLQTDQVSRYLDVARDEGFDGVLTVSNQITRTAGTSPIAIDRRRMKRLGLWHLSWWQILTDAIIQHRYHKIADPDQAWLLGELIAYLDHENSGASGFQDMGDRWVTVRDKARNSTLRPSDKDLPAIVDRWEQFIQFLCLGLSQDLGREVQPQTPRRETTDQRVEGLKRRLVDEGRLSAAVRVPDAVAPVELDVDFRARTVVTNVTVDLPREGRPLTRLNWLIRQLKDAPDDLRLTTGFANVRLTTSGLLQTARKRPESLLAPNDPKREPRWVQLALSRPLGLKRGRGSGTFVGETRRQTVDFYAQIVQQVKSWQAAAPRLPREQHTADEELVAQPDPPAFSQTDARLPGDASEPLDPEPQAPGLT